MNRRAAALALALLLPLAVQAEKLRVDVLIFLTPPTAKERGTPPRHPQDERAIGIDDLRGLAYAGIALMPDDATTLGKEWAALQASRRYRPLLRLCWLQEVPRAEAGPALRLYLPGGDGVSGFGGWLRLHGGGTQLALSADLEIIETGGGVEPLAFRLKQRRALGIDQLSYLDSPRIGVLARVTKAR